MILGTTGFLMLCAKLINVGRFGGIRVPGPIKIFYDVGQVRRHLPIGIRGSFVTTKCGGVFDFSGIRHSVSSTAGLLPLCAKLIDVGR